MQVGIVRQCQGLVPLMPSLWENLKIGKYCGAPGYRFAHQRKEEVMRVVLSLVLSVVVFAGEETAEDEGGSVRTRQVEALTRQSDPRRAHSRVHRCARPRKCLPDH